MDQQWEKTFVDYFCSLHDQDDDASHDLEHFKRVAHKSKHIAMHESDPVDLLVILAAAYFHDVVNLPKNHPERHLGSQYSAKKAREILHFLDFPKSKIDHVCHAIEAHSFSAQLKPETLEAKIVQDADRIESLGALGVMRTFYVSGRIKRPPYDPQDLFATNRPLNDSAYALDHFYCKLFKLYDLLQTKGGREIALKRTEFLKFFVQELEANIKTKEGGALKIVWTCHDAGRNNQKFWHANDAFAEQRQLEPSHFVLDQLLEQKNNFAFIKTFLQQLQEEISV